MTEGIAIVLLFAAVILGVEEMKHNVEFSGGAPLHGAASAGTQGYASGGGKDES